MSKGSVIKEKKERSYKFNWRRQKEMLLGLDDKSYARRMAKIMAEKEIELLAIEEEHQRLGYCKLCGTANTIQGTCMNAFCMNRFAVKPKLSRDEWFNAGVEFSLRRVIQVIDDMHDTGA